MTLRERTTQYGIIVNLPHDHTALSVNSAVGEAFADLPPHMKRTLTWDQCVEMAKHQDLTSTSGVPIYFAERCSPWQRGANENFNGLARQYFLEGTDWQSTRLLMSPTSPPSSTTGPAKASATTPRPSDSLPRSLTHRSLG